MSGLDMPDSVGSEARSDDDDRKKLDGLMRFAHGVLTARDKVQMSMATGLGVYHEDDIFELPGVHFNEADGAWLRIERLRESKPQAPDDYIMEFMSSNGADPARRPEIRPAISKEVPIELASDLAEAELLRPENLRTVTERGVELTSRVQVTLLAEDCPEMTRNFETWRDEVWSDWARTEKPIRRSITLYQSLFKLHAAIHAAENLPPEVVWGIGVGRWKTETEVIDMPLIEQLVDIEIEDKGPIAIRPRDLPPSLSLKPYIHVEISGAAKLQNESMPICGRLWISIFFRVE